MYEHFSLKRILKGSPFKSGFYFYSHNQIKYICLALYTFHTYTTQKYECILKLFKRNHWWEKYCASAFWQPHNAVSLRWRNSTGNWNFTRCYIRWWLLTPYKFRDNSQHFVSAKFRKKEPNLAAWKSMFRKHKCQNSKSKGRYIPVHTILRWQK